jgi:hypothetical protein
MFQNPTLCAERAEHGMAGVSAARLAVHCFAQTAGVNSPLRCSVLDRERARLWISLSARRNPPFAVARREYAITTAHLNKVRENVFFFPTAAASEPSRELRGTSQDGRPWRKSGVVLRAVSINSLTCEPRKIKNRK